MPPVKEEKKLQIKPFDTHNLGKTEFLSQQNQFRKAVEKTGADVLGVSEQFEKWKLLHEEVLLAVRKARRGSFTKKIVEKNKKRIKIYRAMVQTNKAALNHRLPEVVEAATSLANLFRANKKILATPMSINTNSIDNILSRLNEKYVAAVETVGLGDWVEYLTEINNELWKLFDARDKEDIARNQLNLRKSRKKLTEQYQLICRIINVFADINGDEKYVDFIKLLNSINDNWRKELRREKTLREKKEEKNKESETSG